MAQSAVCVLTVNSPLDNEQDSVEQDQTIYVEDGKEREERGMSLNDKLIVNSELIITAYILRILSIKLNCCQISTIADKPSHSDFSYLKLAAQTPDLSNSNMFYPSSLHFSLWSSTAF